MRTRYEAYIDGMPLSGVAKEIYITDIVEVEPRITKDTYAFALADGTKTLRKRKESVTVEVRMQIRAYDIERRQRIMDELHLWARGERLSINTRPGQYLQFEIEEQTVIDSALKWTQTIKMVFIARGVPYWQDERPARLELVGTSGEGVLRPLGTALKCPVEMIVKNVGDGTMGSFSASVGEYEMDFVELGIDPGQSFSVVYENGIQKLPVDKRAPESSDDLWAYCGKANDVSFTADQTAEVNFIARGRFD